MLFGTILRNRYKILTKLGSGGFSDTYLAEDMDLPGNPKCVVKHLQNRNPDPEILPIAKRLFNREAEVLYRLGKRHDQIPELLAHFEENGEFFLVQEFVDGHDLTAEITPDKPLSEDEVLIFLQEILEVLAVVHEHKVIHRDIKLQNIMRRRDGKLVLIDFGSVKEIKSLATSNHGEITSTIVIGTPGYIPNEQANGNPRLCSDVYAVGMIGIQALTGIQPRKLPIDPNNGEIVWRNLVNVTDTLANILTNMVRYNFSQRYQTAAEALQALQASPPPTTIGKTSASKNTVLEIPSSQVQQEQGIPGLGLFGLIGVGFGIAMFGGRFFQFSLGEHQPIKTTNPTVEGIKNQLKTSSPTPKTKHRTNDSITSPSPPSFNEQLNQPTVELSTPVIERKFKPSTPAIEDKLKPSIPIIEDKLKPSTPAIEDTLKPSIPIIEDKLKPSIPAIEDDTKPCTPAIEDDTNSCTPAIEDNIKPSPPTLEDNIKPFTPTPTIEGNIKPSAPTLEDNIKPFTPTIEDGKNQMMIVPSTPYEQNKNNQMMIVPSTPYEQNKNNQMTVPSTPIFEDKNNQITVPSTPIVQEKDNQITVPSTPLN